MEKRKTAVITGGASGIGFATAVRFLEGGYQVAITDANEQRLMEAKEKLEKDYPGCVLAKVSNVTDYASVQALRDAVLEAFGSVEALVNCAGVFRGGMIHEVQDADYDLQFDVNVRGIYHTMKAFVGNMMENHYGAIVNISSASGIRGDYNCPIYSATKAAVANLSRAAAMDYAAYGIRINCVAPSATKTPMFLTGSTEEVINAFINAMPDRKLGEPKYVARAIFYLCSDEADHIVGHNLPVDGGLTEWNGQPRQDKQE